MEATSLSCVGHSDAASSLNADVQQWALSFFLHLALLRTLASRLMQRLEQQKAILCYQGSRSAETEHGRGARFCIGYCRSRASKPSRRSWALSAKSSKGSMTVG